MTPNIGDEEMVRTIIEQVADTLEARRKREEGRIKASWPAWLALTLSIAAAIFAAGILRSDVAQAMQKSEDNRRDITSIQAGVGDQRAALARIETNINILMDERKGHRR